MTTREHLDLLANQSLERLEALGVELTPEMLPDFVVGLASSGLLVALEALEAGDVAEAAEIVQWVQEWAVRANAKNLVGFQQILVGEDDSPLARRIRDELLADLRPETSNALTPEELAALGVLDK